MDSFPDENWYNEAFQSLNEAINPDFRPELPPILETDWDFDLGWIQESNAQADSHVPINQSAGSMETLEHLPPVATKLLSNLQEQVKQLQQTVLELRNTVCERLDNMEKSVTAAQCYVNNLVPWSMEVHENYSKLMEVMMESDKGKMVQAGIEQPRGQ